MKKVYFAIGLLNLLGSAAGRAILGCFRDYGGRGIHFLFESFEQFLEEVGLRPSNKHSLDRKNNDGHYTPGNIRWATRKEQNFNKRRHAAIQNFSTEELLAELARREKASQQAERIEEASKDDTGGSIALPNTNHASGDGLVVPELASPILFAIELANAGGKAETNEA